MTKEKAQRIFEKYEAEIRALPLRFAAVPHVGVIGNDGELQYGIIIYLKGDNRQGLKAYYEGCPCEVVTNCGEGRID